LIFNCFSVYGAYEEPEISYGFIPDYIAVGQKAVIDYTIDVPGYSEIKGNFSITGATAGKSITFYGKQRDIKYKYYFPNGGWHYAITSITPEVTLDVVEIKCIKFSKNYGVVNRAAKFTAETDPAGYEYLVHWETTGPASFTDEGLGDAFTLMPPNGGIYKIYAKIFKTNQKIRAQYRAIKKNFKNKKITSLETYKHDYKSTNNTKTFQQTYQYIIETKPKGYLTNIIGSGNTNAQLFWDIRQVLLDPMSIVGLIFPVTPPISYIYDASATVQMQVFGSQVNTQKFGPKTGLASDGHSAFLITCLNIFSDYFDGNATLKNNQPPDTIFDVTASGSIKFTSEHDNARNNLVSFKFGPVSASFHITDAY